MACFCCPSTERKKSLVDSRSSTRIASGTPHSFQDARSNPASRLSHPATTRPPRSAQREKMARPSSSSTARRQFRGPTGIGGRGFYSAHLLREAVAKPASNQKIPNLFNAGKPQTPGNGAYLFRPSASQTSDRDAQVGMFEIEGLARRHARQLHPAHEQDGESDGVSPCHPERSEGSHAFGKRR